MTSPQHRAKKGNYEHYGTRFIFNRALSMLQEQLGSRCFSHTLVTGARLQRTVEKRLHALQKLPKTEQKHFMLKDSPRQPYFHDASPIQTLARPVCV